MDKRRALNLTASLWDEARKEVLRRVTPDAWRKLTLDDRAALCTGVVKELLALNRIPEIMAAARIKTN